MLDPLDIRREYISIKAKKHLDEMPQNDDTDSLKEWISYKDEHIANLMARIKEYQDIFDGIAKFTARF